jgi:hypothetical protein
MNTFAIEPQQSRRPTREEGLAIASQRKEARRRRTARIRKTVAVLAVAAFIGPFGFLYQQMAAGKDPSLAGTQPVAMKAATTTSSASTDTTTAAPVTTQQS